MSNAKQFVLPDLGEGLPDAEILSWLVAPGDLVSDGQEVCEVETAKASVVLPVPFDGMVAELLAPVGALIAVGAPIMSVDVAVAPAPQMLVGSGPPAELGTPPQRRRRRNTAAGIGVPASPAPVPEPPLAPPEVSAPEGAGVRRVPVTGVRRATAQAMVKSVGTAAHAAEFVTVDLTRTMRLTRWLRQAPDWQGRSASPLLIAAAALLQAIRRHPEINASWEDLPGGGSEIVIREQVNLGIAVATEHGLVVPNIKDAGRLGLPALADALSTLTAAARARQSTPADLTGGTVTITNLGSIGVHSGFPILNPGESAILCLGAAQEQPWMHRGQVVPRMIAQLGLTFDHRLVDGALAAAVLTDIAAVLTDPRLLMIR